MKRFLTALLAVVLAVSSAWADVVVYWRVIWAYGGFKREGVSVYSHLPQGEFREVYNAQAPNNVDYEMVFYFSLQDAKTPPAWAAALGGEYEYSISNVSWDSEKNILTGYDLAEELVIPWEDYGLSVVQEASDGIWLESGGVQLKLDMDGNLSHLGYDVGQIDTSSPGSTFANIGQMWADAPEGAGVTNASANGYLAVESGDGLYYYRPSDGTWWVMPGEAQAVGNPWLSDDGGDGGSTGGDGGSTGGGDGGGSTSGGGSTGGGSTGGDGGGSTSGGGSTGGGSTGGGGSSSGGGSSGGGSTSGGDGGGSSTGGDGGDSGPVVVPGGGDDETSASGEDWEYDYRAVLQSINSGVASVANQATAANGTLTNIEGALDDLAGEYSETDGASEVSSADGSALSSAASSGLSNVSGALESLGADVGSGWSDVSSNLFGWVDGFSTVPPSVLSMGSFKINLLGVQKDVVLDVNLSSVSDWLLLIRRALILLWGAITLFVVFRLFRWLTAEIVKGIRWLLGVIPKAFSIVATGA